MTFTAFDPTLIVLPFNHLDDISFDAVLYEMLHGRINIYIDYDHLEMLVFNPVEHLASSERLSINSSLDPDLNFYTCSQTNSNYIVEK